MRFYVILCTFVSHSCFIHYFYFIFLFTSHSTLTVPQNKDDFGKCNLGEGCLADCSGKGVCLPVRIDRPTVPLTSSPSSSPTATPDARSNSPTAAPTSVTTALPFTPSGSPTALPVQSSQGPSSQGPSSQGPSSSMTGQPISNKPTVFTIIQAAPSISPALLIDPTYAPTSYPTISFTPSFTPTGTGSPSRITVLSDSSAALMSVSAVETLLTLTGDTLVTSPYVPSSSLYCHCDTGWYGPSCVLSSPPMCLASTFNILLDLFDSFGDGWTFANYAITNADTGMVVDGAFDSLCAGKADGRSYCVTPGMYTHAYVTHITSLRPLIIFLVLFTFCHISSSFFSLQSPCLALIIASPHSLTSK